MKRCAIVFAAGMLWLPGAVEAAGSRNPDWPCVQAKVPELSLSAVWQGPAIGDAIRGQWRDQPGVRELVSRLAARRTPMEEAEAMIAGYVTGPDKEKKAKLLFAGLFESLNSERSAVMAGIEKFARRRQELADQMRDSVAKLEALRKASADAAKVDELANQIEWERRIYEDRRKTVGYVCEVPVLIERRLFALGRAIVKSLE